MSSHLKELKGLELVYFIIFPVNDLNMQEVKFVFKNSEQRIET